MALVPAFNSNIDSSLVSPFSQSSLMFPGSNGLWLTPTVERGLFHIDLVETGSNITVHAGYD